MNKLRISALAIATSIAALACSPAWADLYVYGGATKPGITNRYDGTGLGNGQDVYSGSVNNFGVALIISGQGSLGGNDLFDISNVSIDNLNSGSNSLVLEVTETNLTSLTGVQSFLNTFTGTISNQIDVTATFYINTNNSQTVDGTSQQLAQITCNAGSCSSYSKEFQKLINNISGPFSLTEEFDITANFKGKLSSDDDVSQVPEPMTLSLLGAGLVGLGALRRRRKAAKSA